MLTRIIHAFVGHTFIVQSKVFCPPIRKSGQLFHRTDYHEVHGFTVIVLICSCGASSTCTVTGDHRE